MLFHLELPVSDTRLIDLEQAVHINAKNETRDHAEYLDPFNSNSTLFGCQEPGGCG